MQRTIFFLFWICMSISPLQSQLNVSPIWCFGEYAGLDFRSNPPGVFTSSVNTGEGSAGATDQYGNVWFYTDGMKVFDRNHNQMPNGINLTGSPSSSQSAIVLQHPSQRTKGQFYILTVPEYGGAAGFCYSVLDITLNGGLGDISKKNVKLGGVMAEQMQPAMHANGKDYWVVIKGYRNDSLHVYLIDSTGIKKTSSIKLGKRVDNTIGTMRFNKDYSKFAFTCYDYSGYVQICDFNNQTGVISNLMVIDNLYDPYGVNFSPDGKVLYVSHLLTKKLRQYDLSSYNITAIKSSIVALSDNVVLGNINYAYDGHLYVAQTGSYALGRINHPNVLGTGCDFLLNEVSTGSHKCIYGLPLFYIYPVYKIISSVNGDCVEDSVSFTTSLKDGLDSIQWLADVGSGYFKIGYKSSFKYKFKDTGLIRIMVTNGLDTDFLSVRLRKCQVFKAQVHLLDSCINGDLKVSISMNLPSDTIMWYISQGAGYTFVDTGKTVKLKGVNLGVNTLRIVSEIGTLDTTLTFYACDTLCLFKIPNVFTPNEDSLNDRFMYSYPCAFEKFHLEVYNRWGEKLFSTDKQDDYWDGTYKGNICPDGVYLWIAVYKELGKEESEINGVVHLLR